MRQRRLFRRVWLAWGKRWAVQFWPEPYFSLGFHVDPRRPILDIHVGWVIVALGARPVITCDRDRHRHSCRGFMFADDPIL